MLTISNTSLHNDPNIYAIGCCSPSILFCDQYRSLTSKNHFIFMQLVVCMVQSVSQLRWQVNTITDGRQHIQYNTQLYTGNVHWQFKKVVVVSPIERGTTDLFLDNPFLCCNTHPFFQLCTSLHPDKSANFKNIHQGWQIFTLSICNQSPLLLGVPFNKLVLLLWHKGITNTIW